MLTKKHLLWFVLASFTSGLILFVLLCVSFGLPQSHELGLWFWPVICVAVITLIVRYLRKHSDNAARQHLFTADLIILSFGVATILSLAHGIWPQYFFRIGITGGLTVLIAGAAAFIRASRIGLLDGKPRYLFAGGSFLLFIGILGMSIMPFMLLLLLIFSFLGGRVDLELVFIEDRTGAVKALAFGVPLALIGTGICKNVQNELIEVQPDSALEAQTKEGDVTSPQNPSD